MQVSKSGNNLRARLWKYMRDPENLGKEQPDVVIMGVQEMAEKMSATQAAVKNLLTSMTKETGSNVFQISPSIFEFRPAPAQLQERDMEVGVRSLQFMASTEPGSLWSLKEIAERVGGEPSSVSQALSKAVRFDPASFITRPMRGVYSYRPPMYPGLGAPQPAPEPVPPPPIPIHPGQAAGQEFLRSVAAAVPDLAIAEAIEAPAATYGNIHLKTLTTLPDGRVLAQDEAGKPYWVTPVQ